MTGIIARRLLIGLVAANLVVGCAAFLRQPEIRFDGLRLMSLNLAGGTIEARFAVYNPNRYALRTAAITYELELGNTDGAAVPWLRLASGEVREAMRIAAGDTAVLAVPVTFRYQDVGAALRAVLSRRTVDYRVSGTVSIAEPMRRSVPYRRTGNIPLVSGG